MSNHNISGFEKLFTCKAWTEKFEFSDSESQKCICDKFMIVVDFVILIILIWQTYKYYKRK